MTRDYTLFEPHAYNQIYEYSGKPPPSREPWLATIAQFYQFSGLQKDEGRVLEFGGGPHITPLVSAARYAKEIVFAEYLEANRNVVAGWKSGEVDFSSFIQTVVTKAEENSTESVEERAAALRDKLSIIPCDLLEEDPLLGYAQGPFDVISTHLCLEAAATTKEMYNDSVAKLSKLLKGPGSKFFASIGIECSYFMVEDTKFTVTPLTVDDIKEGFSKAGFTSIDTSCSMFPAQYPESGPALSDIKGICTIIATL